MTLLEIIKALKDIALLQPEVRSVSDGDVYDAMNGNPSLKYSVFHVTQTSHSSNEGWDSYGLSLFLIDRLTDDNANRLEIQSRAKETLGNIIAVFCDNFDAEHNAITFTPFTEKFKDNTAGVWANVTVNVMSDAACPSDYLGEGYYPSITVIDNLDIYIKENGVYEVPDGYTGYGKITVNLQIQDSKDVTLRHNDNYQIHPDEPNAGMAEVIVRVDVPMQEQTKYVRAMEEHNEYVIEPDPEYDGMSRATVDVHVPLQTKTKILSENGYYEVRPDEDYTGLKDVHIAVDVPIQETKHVELTDNTHYTITKDDEFAGMKELSIDVNVPIPQIEPFAMLSLRSGDEGILTPSEGYDGLEGVRYNVKMDKMRIPNGITLSGSTWEEFDGSAWDWSLVYDCESMFNKCSNVKRITGINMNPKCCNDMFSYCSNLEELDLSGCDFSELLDIYAMFRQCNKLTSVDVSNINTAKCDDFSALFYNCVMLEEIIGLSNWVTSNVTSMQNTFYNARITKLDLSNWDVSNVKDMESAFDSCTNLVELKMGGPLHPNLYARNAFYHITTSGTFYYPKEYDYSTIINVLPSTWTAVPY